MRAGHEDRGMHDGEAQRKQAGTVTTKRKQPMNRTERTLRAGASAEAADRMERIRASGPLAQALLRELFPKGYHLYPLGDQLATLDRLEKRMHWMAVDDKGNLTSKDALAVQRGEMTPEAFEAELEKDRRDLFGLEKG